jgi:hypothetical protein
VKHQDSDSNETRHKPFFYVTVILIHLYSITLAGLVIIPKHETMWAEAEEAAESVQTGVGAISIVLDTLIHILTSVVVCCQMGARDTITAALVSSRQVVAQVLAGTMPIP